MLQYLPDELLLMIFKKIKDIKDFNNLYRTGNERIRNILVALIKEADLSFSTLATGRTLTSPFFKFVSQSIQVLNLSGIADLTKTVLLPAMKRLRGLKDLDVSYTTVNIFEFLEMYEVCPTIESIAIDFMFNKIRERTDVDIVTEEMLEKCQNTFRNFKNVHFVGSQALYKEDFAYILLENVKLNRLRFTIARFNHCIEYPREDVEFEPLYCNMFCIDKTEIQADIFFRISFDYEYLKFSPTSLDASPKIADFLVHHLTLPPPHFYDIDTIYYGMMIWNKETTEFDDKFFSDLLETVKQLPRFVSISSRSDNTIESLSLRSDWFFLTDQIFKPKQIGLQPVIPENSFKRIRRAPPNQEINFDDMYLFKDKENIQMNITFQDSVVAPPISFANQLNFMRILTFLSLKGAVHYSKDFFSVLFRNCEKLVTLSVEGPTISPCAINISRTIALSRSLKNLRIKEKNINFNVLLNTLGQCKTLENIVLHDGSQIVNDLAKPDTLFAQCDNLYYISIYAQMSDASKNRQYQSFNKAKIRFGKYHLHFEILSRCVMSTMYVYNPYYHVYNNNCQFMPINFF